MGYSKEIYEQATRTLTERRMDAEARAEALRARAVAKDPRVGEIERQLANSVLQVSRLVLEGMDGRPHTDLPAKLAAVQQENLALQQELARRLHTMGEQADNFDPQPVCRRCNDTGYVDGGMCDCLTRLLQEAACKELSALSHMALTRFGDMDLSYYTGADRQKMADVIAFCRAYAEDFSADSPSLLLQGPAGTGKTHLSLAIAGEVATKGMQVIYGSVGRLLRQLEKEHFGRDEGDSADRLETCDLLILDDLGTEFASPFYTSSLYELLNARLLSGLPTVISTNLGQNQLQERYGVQIASRITGCFQPLRCVGEDIRQQKRIRDLKE